MKEYKGVLTITKDNIKEYEDLETVDGSLIIGNIVDGVVHRVDVILDKLICVTDKIVVQNYCSLTADNLISANKIELLSFSKFQALKLKIINDILEIYYCCKINIPNLAQANNLFLADEFYGCFENLTEVTLNLIINKNGRLDAEKLVKVGGNFIMGKNTYFNGNRFKEVHNLTMKARAKFISLSLVKVTGLSMISKKADISCRFNDVFTSSDTAEIYK